MKLLTVLLTALLSFQGSAAELTDLFPYSCILVTKTQQGDEDYKDTVVYKNAGYLDYAVYPIPSLNNSSFQILYAGDNKFQVVYRRFERASEKLSRKRGIEAAIRTAQANGELKTAKQLSEDFDWNSERKLTATFAEEIITVDTLISGKEYRFTVPELPDVALACIKKK